MNDEKAKILAIFAYHGYFGGERANYKAIEMMCSSGAHVKFVLEKDCDSAILDLMHKEKKEYIKLKFGPQTIGLKNSIYEYFSIVKHMILVPYKLKRELKNNNYTHIYIPNYIQFFYVWILLFFNKKYAVIFRIGDVPSIGVLHSIMWKYLINTNVDKFVTNSRMSYKCLERNIGSTIRKKTRIIRNTLASNLLVKYEKKIPDKIFRVGFLGQMNAEKGVIQALQTAKELCRNDRFLQFMFAGEDRSNDQVVSSLIKSIQLDKNYFNKVLFLGKINNQDIVNFFCNIDVLIVPSLFEDSAPNVIIEAKYFSVPVVVFDSGGISELVENKQDGLICDGYNTNALIKGVEYYRNNKEVLAQHSKQSKKSYDRFSNTVIQKKWLKLL